MKPACLWVQCTFRHKSSCTSKLKSPFQNLRSTMCESVNANCWFSVITTAIYTPLITSLIKFTWANVFWLLNLIWVSLHFQSYDAQSSFTNHNVYIAVSVVCEFLSFTHRAGILNMQ